MQQLTASVRTFKQKYLCLPGDCRNASSFGWRPNASNTYNNGDGNESIARNNGVPTECINFWHHLGKAGFIADAYKGNDGNGGGCSGQGISPPIANGKGWVATIGPAGGSAYASASTEGRLGNLFYLSGRRQSDGYYFPIYTAIEAYNIDAKVDDGFPVSGLIRTGQVYHSIGATDGSYWTDGCVILPGNIYDVRGLYVQDNGPLETTRNPDSRDCMIAWGRAY